MGVEVIRFSKANADNHPVMNRMHKPEPKLPPDRQDKRSVEHWLQVSRSEAAEMLVPPPLSLIEAGPA